jgi:hypothetical protein
MERALMSPAGYQFLIRLAPPIDKVLIPRTNGRLSSAGIDRVGSSRRPVRSPGWRAPIRWY